MVSLFIGQALKLLGKTWFVMRVSKEELVDLRLQLKPFILGHGAVPFHLADIVCAGCCLFGESFRDLLAIMFIFRPSFKHG